MKKLRKNKKGFTLVELVVVIAILAILASTATVATIAILNNARKTPVSDAAGKLKDAMQQYYLDDSYPETLAGFTNYLKVSLPDVSVDGTVKTNVTAATDDAIHIALSRNSELKSGAKASWTATVYTKYYKCEVVYQYDSTNKTLLTPKVGDVVKF